jgi:hypothetical protein
MILTWTLTTAPAQLPDCWVLFMDGNVYCSLENQVPYVGPGTYNVDLTQLDSNVQITDGAQHTFSVALMGQGVVGPQSPAATATVPAPTLQAGLGGITTAAPVPISWPAATAVSAA